MSQESTKIKNFTDLEAWKAAELLVKAVYRVTEILPDSEKYGLISQLRRSSTSVTANIAEGFGRRGVADRLNFYTIALGSLSETQSHIMVLEDVGYIDNSLRKTLFNVSIKAHKLLNGLIKATREGKNTQDSRLLTRSEGA